MLDDKNQHYMLASEFYQNNPESHINIYLGKTNNKCATFTTNTIMFLNLCIEHRIFSMLNYNIHKKPKTSYRQIHNSVLFKTGAKL